MKRTLIRHATIVNEGQSVFGSVVIEDGCIAEVLANRQTPSAPCDSRGSSSSRDLLHVGQLCFCMIHDFRQSAWNTCPHGITNELAASFGSRQMMQSGSRARSETAGERYCAPRRDSKRE